MRVSMLLVVSVMGPALLSGGPAAAELKPATLRAFEQYVGLTEARMKREIERQSPFLWVDRLPANQRAATFARHGRGEIVSERLQTRRGSQSIEVDDGMIHHWIGTVLLPGVPLARAQAFLQDYDRYAQRFSPTIQRSRILRAENGRFVVQMRTWAKKVLTVVHDTDYLIDYQRLGPTRLYTKSVAMNIHHIESAGEPDERRIPGDQSSGFLWRLNTYCSFEERAEGTYEQCESISLTRSIPFGLGFLINPFVNDIPRETLEFTLGRVRAGLS